MTSLVARASLGLSKVMRSMGSTLDSMGKNLEITKYTEKLVPSTRFVAVDGVAPRAEFAGFVAPSASVIGDVSIGKNSSIWYGTVVRGDVNQVTIGDNTSIGDRSVVHVAKIQGDFPTRIGNNVVIGAGALVHAAEVHDTVIIGEAAQVLDGATVETQSIVAAASVVTPGTTVKTGELWGGSPAKKIRGLAPAEIDAILQQASELAALASMHAYEHSKDYKQVLEEEEIRDIEDYLDESAPRKPERDISDVQGQGHPGRIFRSTLTHPEDVSKQKQSQ